MRLLQTEIDVIPGNRPNRGARPEGWVGEGSAVVEITNLGELENAFTLRVECDHAYWQPNWARFDALPPQGDGNKPPVGKPDLPGPKNSTLRLHLSRGASRQAILSFTLPRTSEARAGVYQLRVIVETVVTGTAAAERFTEFPATLIVRPFFEFAVESEPAEKRAGILKRKARFTLKVINKGNDWLYVDLKAGKSNTVGLDVPASRLAVPPPEPGAESDRTLPLEATTKLRTFRGLQVDTPLPIEITRVDAPSIPPLNEEAMQGGPALTGGAVLVTETREAGVMAEPAQLAYHPPIPATLTGFFQALARNVKGLVLAALALMAMFTMGAILFERGFRKINTFDVAEAPTNADGVYSIPNGGSFTLRGEWLDRAEFQLFVKGQPGDGPAEVISSDNVKLVPYEQKRSGAALGGRAKDALSHLYLATITPQLQNSTIVMIKAVRRLPILGSLGVFEPAVIRKPIIVGAVASEKAVAPPTLASSELAPGEPIVILGEGLGTSGEILVGGKTASGVEWTDKKITVPVPSDVAASGRAFNVVGTPKSGTQFTFSDVHIKVDAISTAGGTTAGTDGTVAGGGTAGGSGGGSAGGSGSPAGGTTGGSAGGTGGGTGGNAGGSKETGPVTTAPVGYAEALTAIGSGGRADWEALIKATEGSKDPETVALRTIALASLNRKDDADNLINPFAEKIDKLPKHAYVYVYTASLYLESIRKEVPASTLSDGFAAQCKSMSELIATRRKTAEASGRPYGEGDALPYLLYASFLRRSGLGSPDTILRKVDPAFASAAEQKAAAQLKQTP